MRAPRRRGQRVATTSQRAARGVGAGRGRRWRRTARPPAPPRRATLRVCSRKPDLQDEQEQEQHQHRDERELDDAVAASPAGLPACERGRSGAGSCTESMASAEDRRAARAWRRPTVAVTMPAVMSVISTQPGTSPRSRSIGRPSAVCSSAEQEQERGRARVLRGARGGRGGSCRTTKREPVEAREQREQHASPAGPGRRPGPSSRSPCLPAVSSSCRLPASRTSTACARSTSASGVPRSTAMATPSTKRASGGERRAAGDASSACTSEAPARASASARPSSRLSSPARDAVRPARAPRPAPPRRSRPARAARRRSGTPRASAARAARPAG